MRPFIKGSQLLHFVRLKNTPTEDRNLLSLCSRVRKRCRTLSQTNIKNPRSQIEIQCRTSIVLELQLVAIYICWAEDEKSCTISDGLGACV